MSVAVTYHAWTPSEQRRDGPTELEGRPVEEVAVDRDRFAPRPRPVETAIVVWQRTAEPAKAEAR